MTAPKRRFPTGCPEIGLTIRVGESAKLGHWDPQRQEIVVSPHQPEAGMHVVLLHELLHAVDDALVAAGVTARRTSHRWIESAAPNLLLALVTAGVYTGIGRDEMLRFYRKNARGNRRHRKERAR